MAVLILGPVAITAVLGPTAARGLIVLIWYGEPIQSPMLTYAVPAVGQQWRGRGRAHWADATLAGTGRTPLLFTELAAWPATGGGRHGTGVGFELIEALAVTTANTPPCDGCSRVHRTSRRQERSASAARHVIGLRPTPA